MKNAIAVLLLLFGQTVLAQSEDRDRLWREARELINTWERYQAIALWDVKTEVDVIDDTVNVVLSKFTDRVDSTAGNLEGKLAFIAINCQQKVGYPSFSVVLPESGPRFLDLEDWENVEVTYRIGTDDAVTNQWLWDGVAFHYQPMFIDDGVVNGISDASVFVAALVQNNSYVDVTDRGIIDIDVDDSGDDFVVVGEGDEVVIYERPRFVFRARYQQYGTVTAIWYMDGLAKAADECMAALDAP